MKIKLANALGRGATAVLTLSFPFTASREWPLARAMPKFVYPTNMRAIYIARIGGLARTIYDAIVLFLQGCRQVVVVCFVFYIEQVICEQFVKD